ncbi:MAG: single-stranded DNA-binding protein [Candidatus Nanoarchaeia archaeon]|nr:single-stranded DNA-binding protein [Candidatus Nanoarchaeia archaeon]
MANYFSAPMINKVMIAGNVVCEPRVNLTHGNKKKVANFRIACSRKFRTKAGELKEDSCYVSVTAWLQLAELCEQNLEKGDKVYIEGSLQTRQISGSEMSVVEILADRIQILTPKKVVIDEEHEEHLEHVETKEEHGAEQ